MLVILQHVFDHFYQFGENQAGLLMLDWGSEPSGLLPHAYRNVPLVAYCGCLNFNCKSFYDEYQRHILSFNPLLQANIWHCVCLFPTELQIRWYKGWRFSQKQRQSFLNQFPSVFFAFITKEATTCEQNQIVPLTHSACQFQYCCCLNIIDFAHQ